MEVILDYNEKKNLGRVIIDNQSFMERLSYAFSCPNEGKKFVKSTMKFFIPDRINFINSSGYFKFGIMEDIVKWIKSNCVETSLKFKPTDSFLSYYKTENESKFINNLAFKPRDYQKDCVELAMKHRYGTFVLGTGAGKTFTIALLLDNLFHHKKVKKTLILVPDNGLVTQFNDELKNVYKIKQKINLFFDNQTTIDDDCEIVIANRPLFLSRFDQYSKFWKEEVDCLIVDEAHSIKRGNKVSKCIEKMKAKWRFGFTGTLSENMEDKMTTIGNLGPVRYEKTSKQLRDEGFLSDVVIHRVCLHYPTNDAPDDYLEEMNYLETNSIRNDFLSSLMIKLPKNSLIMVNHLEHGFALESVLKKVNEKFGNKKEIFFIRGEVDVETRDVIKKMMEEKNNVICIAITKIFSTGINIKNLHNIVLAAGGKSSITVVQSIGRGLRLHPDKKELNIFDISDVGFKYSMRHSEKRLKIYEQEKIPVKEVNLKL